jgi:hypothetical protein
VRLVVPDSSVGTELCDPVGNFRRTRRRGVELVSPGIAANRKSPMPHAPTQREGELSAESIGKTAFLGVARPRGVELARCGSVEIALHSSSGSKLAFADRLVLVRC